MLNHTLYEEIIPNIQYKPPLVQLETVSSSPTTCHLRKETNTLLATTSIQVIVESDEVSPQPLFYQERIILYLIFL